MIEEDARWKLEQSDLHRLTKGCYPCIDGEVGHPLSANENGQVRSEHYYYKIHKAER